MNIRPADPSDKTKWNEYVHNHPDAAAYHLFAWKEAVEQGYRHKTYYFIAEQNNQIQGVFPLVYFKIPFMAGTLVALPFCDVGTVLGDNPEILKKLIAEAVFFGKKLGVKLIDLRGNIPETVLDEVGTSVQQTSGKVRMLLKLPGSSEDLWKSFKSKLRSQVRKAEKNGLKFSQADNVNDFYLVFSQNMRDLGSPVHSKKWFQEVIKYFGENARIGLVSFEGKTIGAGIILGVAKKISIPWASTLRQFNRLGPNMLLYWNFLKYASDNGFNIFDFGRSTPDEGTYKFKSQWGAKPDPLVWHNLILKGEASQQKESSNSTINKRKLAEDVWRKLPQGAANFLGPMVRKYISL